MKQCKITLLVGMLGLILAPTIFAQHIDANRMNRDIRIMENILSEIFRPQTEITTTKTYTILGDGFRQLGIRGTYLKNFGIIFMIHKDALFPLRMGIPGDVDFSFHYSINRDNNTEIVSRSVDEDSINKRMAEFLTNYGSIIGQLDDDERIMVIYDANSNSKKPHLIRSLDRNGRKGLKNETEERVPILSASINMKNLTDYRSGKINYENVESRIDFATTENKDYMDLEVMKNIFETGLRESGEESFFVSGKISYLMLENFGAIYSFDARYRGKEGEFFGGFTPGMRRILRSLKDQQIIMEQFSDSLNEEDATIEERELEHKQNMIAAFEGLKRNVVQYIVDYGRTLSSVDSDQYMLTTINLSSSGMDEVPNRIDFKIKKSVLEEYDQGKISREKAIDLVSISYYN